MVHSSTLGDGRTPIAWMQREQNFRSGRPPRRPPSPLSTTTDESSSELETSVSGRRYNRLATSSYMKTDTIRSSRSVPALHLVNSWTGDPCPVHGGSPMLHGYQPGPLLPPHLHVGYQGTMAPTMRRGGSMFDVRGANAYPPQIYSGHPIPPGHIIAPTIPLPDRTLERKSHYGSLQSISGGQAAGLGTIPPLYHLPPMPPSHLLPPGMRPRPLVIPAGAEPLPVRDPSKANNAAVLSSSMINRGLPLNSKALEADGSNHKRNCHCCKGPLPLVWFIISIVTIGVVLGVVLGAIYG